MPNDIDPDAMNSRTINATDGGKPWPPHSGADASAGHPFWR
jgi:hypothetical protein